MTPTAVLGFLLALTALAVGTLAGWTVAALTSLAVDRLRGIAPDARAAIIAQARLMPLILASVFVTAQVVAFARFEVGGPETAGPLLIVTAVVGLVLLVRAVARGIASWRHTRSIIAVWRFSASPLALPNWTGPAWRIERRFPVVAVVGIVRPELFVASQVVEACSPEELAAIVAHESAHVRSRDNLVRLLFQLTPGVGVARAIAGRLDHAWIVAAEEAADAAARRRTAALELASALTKVARLAAACECEAMLASALIGSDNLQARVRRLLEPPHAGRWSRAAWLPLVVALTAATFAQATPALADIHEMFELLVRR